MLNRENIRQMVEEFGPDGYLKLQAQMLGMTADGRIAYNADGKAELRESVTLPNGHTIPRKNPREFHVRQMWEGLVGPVEQTIEYAMDQVGLIEIPRKFQEAISSGIFPSAVGQLIAVEVIAAFDAVSTIGDSLARTVPSSLRGERMVGMTHLQGPKVVVEGEPYQDSTFGERYVTTDEFKKGRLLSVTEELVTFDQTGEILRRAGMLGEAAAQERELTIVRGVADVRSGDRVYRPTGSAEQLYSAGNNNLLATATPLVDWTDIDEALQYHADNVSDDREVDDNMGAQPIILGRTDLLVSNKLNMTARRIVNATEVRGTAGTNEELIAANPLAGMGIQVFSSAYLDRAAADAADDQYTDSDDWFIGDFQKQFIWKEIWPLSTSRAPAQSMANFERDILAQFKVRYYGGINAIAEQYVIQVNAV